jgi:hypothetical protein
MKKNIVLLTMMTLSLGIEAKVVTTQIAAAKAKEMVAEHVDGFAAEVQSVTPMAYKGKTAYYVVQFAPQGWALVSADDTSAPLIGYSAEGTYQIDNLPYNLEAQMGIFAEQVIDNAQRYTQPHQGWAQEESMIRRANRASSDNVSPLINVTWDQSGVYWKYCPVTSSGQHAYVG